MSPRVAALLSEVGYHTRGGLGEAGDLVHRNFYPQQSGKPEYLTIEVRESPDSVCNYLL